MSGQVHRVERTVRFADCDAAGIVFFPRYFEMLNEVVETWFESALGCSFRTLHLAQDQGVPTARFEVEFHAPSRLEDRLVLELDVERLGRASATLRHRVSCDGQSRLTGRQTIVFVGEQMRARPWPDDLRVRMTPFLISPEAA